MPSNSAAIALFAFHAGELRLGIVAAAVARIASVEQLDDSHERPPHIGQLLRVPSSPLPAEHRMLDLCCGGRTAQLIVDGPIRLTRVGAADLVPLGLGLRGPALLGFSKDGEQLVMLLHAVWLVDKACRPARGLAGTLR